MPPPVPSVPSVPRRREAASATLEVRPAVSERKRRSDRTARQHGGRATHREPRQPRPARLKGPPALDVDALLAHANDPTADLLAEAEEEARQQAERATERVATHRGDRSAAPGDLTDI